MPAGLLAWATEAFGEKKTSPAAADGEAAAKEGANDMTHTVDSAIAITLAARTSRRLVIRLPHFIVNHAPSARPHTTFVWEVWSWLQKVQR
jgi:hypothetical protein